MLTTQNRQTVLSDSRANIRRRCGSYGSGRGCPTFVGAHHRYVVRSLFRGAIPTDRTAPIKVKKFTVEETNLPKTHFSREFMMDLMSFPDQVRNIALVGHLHHGKTAFMDMLVLETHDLGGNTEGKKGEQVTPAVN